MYYDGVCSDESATLVEEHIRECLQCSRLLSDLHSEIEIPKKPVDDLMPLEGIQRQWKKSKWTYIRRGICIALAALILVAKVTTLLKDNGIEYRDEIQNIGHANRRHGQIGALGENSGSSSLYQIYVKKADYASAKVLLIQEK